jgi:hypothetical protein
MGYGSRKLFGKAFLESLQVSSGLIIEEFSNLNLGGLDLWPVLLKLLGSSGNILGARVGVLFTGENIESSFRFIGTGCVLDFGVCLSENFSRL